jgi:hypothetical protein
LTVPAACVTILVMSKPVLAQSDPRVKEILREIEQYTTLGADWDLEGALPVDREAAELAARLAELVDVKARQRGVPWQTPVVGPVADGGVALTWEGTNRRVLTITRPGQVLDLECVRKEANSPPVQQTVSLDDAVELALWALSGE